LVDSILGVALIWVFMGLRPALAQQKVPVVTKPGEPFAFLQNGKLVGFSVNLWEAVAKEAGFAVRNSER
jgi:ABC-type amino acid transport substrate-binding protein